MRRTGKLSDIAFQYFILKFLFGGVLSLILANAMFSSKFKYFRLKFDSPVSVTRPFVSREIQLSSVSLV